MNHNEYMDIEEVEYRTETTLFAHQHGMDHYLSSGAVFQRQWGHVVALNFGMDHDYAPKTAVYLSEKVA